MEGKNRKTKEQIEKEKAQKMKEKKTDNTTLFLILQKEVIFVYVQKKRLRV